MRQPSGFTSTRTRRDAGGLSRRATVTGGLASWLAGCAHPRGRGDEAVRAVLEHVYLVLDAQSWRAVREAQALEALGAVDAGLPAFRVPAPTDNTVYLRGENTYLELMGPENAFGQPVGSVGIGLLVERPGELDRVEARARRAMPVERLQRHVTWGVPAPRPWMQTLWFPAEEDEAVAIWVSEYDPAFLPWLAPSAGAAGIRRADFLSLRYDPTRPLIDLTHLSVGASPERSAAVTQVLALVGWERASDGGWTDGTDVLRIEPEATTVSLELRLRESIPGWRHARCSLQPGPAAGLTATLLVERS